MAQQQVVRLQALLEASRQIHSTIELDEVLCIALQIVVRELELAGAFFTAFGQTYGDVPADLKESLSVGEAASLMAGDSWLRFPLCDKQKSRFADLVVLLPEGRALDLDEIDFLEALSMQAAVAIENARFHVRTVEWQRIESDLASARLVQQSLLPQEMPRVPGYTLAARSVTCYEVGGDYLDIVTMPSGDIAIVLGDVAGKGLTSALVGMSFRSAFRAMLQADLSLAEIATRMNLLHYNEGAESRRRYVTAFLLWLSPGSNTIEVVNAGHNPAFLMTGDHKLHKIAASGTPIGMLPFSTYLAEKYVLGSSARLLVYTDGLTEVFRGEEEFGEERLLQAFSDCAERTPEATLTSLWNTLERFSEGQEQTDDMTALVLSRDPHHGDCQ
ncbi:MULTISPECIES: PP2C family protein-serine/threonine phosphatase [Acidobacteriaceae]|uniref:PP2C family protein-serine/threonine phosphatase n=1 Tax=Acidobacteriaceae TaxID=204434 RepID=UPI0020B1276F|nr:MULTISPECIES: PP2C family protein-serine/threonine phosphatase [Acidobacteriaceae]MDW5267224.1 PP2C family protein-serine/threonine phosphatase [Edaphobacter sp.]